MNEHELVGLLVENVQFQLRHENYDRTLEIRKFSGMISTDEGQEEEVTRARRFEHGDLKEQRKRLYNPITASKISALRKNWKRLTRVEGVRTTFVTTNEAALADLQTDFYNFLPGESLPEWLARTLEHLGVTDPNTWIVYERTDERNEEGSITKTKVWPFVVGCENVLNFDYSYGILQWVVVRTVELERVVEGGGKIIQKLLENFFLYAPGYVVRIREVGQKTVMQDGETALALDVYPMAPKEQMPPGADGIPFYAGAAKSRNFYLKVIQNGTTEVPALVAGAYMDEVTGHQCRVPWFMPAKGLLLDLIRLKVSLDVDITTHVYRKRWEFTKQCTFSDHALGDCIEGYMNGIRDAEHICPSCRGTRKQAGFTTEQEVQQLFLPEDTAQMLELGKLAFTEPIDVSLSEFLQSLIDRRSEQVDQAIFSTDTHRKPDASGAMTAFEVARINEGVHDALVTYMKHFARHFELAYRVGCQYREIPLDSVDFSFPEDLQILTLLELIGEYDAAKKSGVGYEVLAAIQKKIQQKVFEGDPMAQKKIDARYYWKPFADQTAEEVAMIIAGRAPTDYDVVLYQNFVAIFRDIEAANPEFYQMARDKQETILASAVEEYRQRIQLIDQPAPDFAGVGNDNNPNQEAV